MLLKTTTLIATTLLAFSACSAPGRGDDGGGGDGGTGSGTDQNPDGCSEASKQIYVVDDQNNLLQFNGETHEFTTLGVLDCPVQFPAHTDQDLGEVVGEQPFSMAVDRNANIYVLFHDGNFDSDSFDTSEVFKVDSASLACTPTAWHTQHNEEAFGMGFSTDASGGDTDTLFIAGTKDNGISEPTSVSLASVDVSTMTATVKGTLDGQPELTGTGDAKLWGYFPDAGQIQELDKSAGGTQGNPFGNSAITGKPAAWAFAFYGGDFYVFLSKQTGTTTHEKTSTVYQVGPDGTDKGHFLVSTAGAPANTLIVGAGVSTCAPLIIGKSTN